MLDPRPWTLTDIKESMTHLPNVHEVGRQKFGDVLLVFCKEFRPTTHELRHLLMTKMSTDWVKISQNCPQNNIRLTEPDWNNTANTLTTVPA